MDPRAFLLPSKVLLAAVAAAAVLPPAGATRLAGQQSDDAPTAREANRAIEDAIRVMRRFYEDAMWRRTGRVPERCDELAGDDCFGGQRECWARCVPWPDGRPIRVLAALYDSTARFVAGAEPGVDADLLDWLDGQRVGVWARLGELDRARDAANECMAAEWWCEALRGFVDHLMGDAITAERRFRAMLRTMPEDRVCYWTELVLYHDTAAPSAGHRGGRRHCRPQEEYEAFWTLADPLFSRPGNDRFTEHFARHVDMRVHRRYLEKMRGEHPLWHHSVLLRHGWPSGYESAGSVASVQLTYGRRGQGFIFTAPTDSALRATQHAFVPADHDARETHHALHGPVHAIPLQTGFFRRDGRAALLVRSAAPRTPSVAQLLDWRLMAWNGTLWREADVSVRGDTLIAWLDTPWEPQVVSLEAVHADGAFRARTGNAPPGSGSPTAAVSSLVFLDGDDVAPNTLEEAARLARPTITVGRHDRVSAYWELYVDTPHNAVIDFTTTSLVRRGFLPRLLGRRPPVRRVHWTELLHPDDGVYRRSIAMDLHALPAGPYEVRLTLTLHDGTVLESVARVDAGG